NSGNTVKSFEKKVLEAIAKKDPSAAALLKEYSSKVTKAAQKGYLHVKKASRRISRLSSQVSKSISK
ncbi:MAG: 30S ribosomal protein S20, partial [Bdellovibrionales bacterium]|nr:30S ribosomal protein S20 [Bdellovibrionales bacterium]